MEIICKGKAMSEGVADIRAPRASGAKAHVFSATCGTTEEAAEKGQFLSEKPEKRPSGAKARIDFAGLMYGLKPVPFIESSFSASSEVVP